MGNISSREIQLNIDLFKEKSVTIHENYCTFLGNRLWNVFTIPDQEQLLWSLIAVALYGLPKQDRGDFGLSSKEKAVVEDILSKCKRAGEHINPRRLFIAVLYITVRIEKDSILITPVFRVKSKCNVTLRGLYSVAEHTFIDFQGRVYSSWEDYKNTNTWNGCYISMPAGAYYNLENRRRCCDFSYQRDRGYDAALLGSFLGATSTVLVLAPLAPTVAAGALTFSLLSSAFNVYRNGSELFDKHRHQQSLLGKEALLNWLNVSLGVVNLVAGGMKLYKDVITPNFCTGNAEADIVMMESSKNVTDVSNAVTSAAEESSQMLDTAFKLSALCNMVHTFTGVRYVAISEQTKYAASGLDIRRMRALFLHLYGVDVNAGTLRGAYENLSGNVNAETLRQYLLTPEVSAAPSRERAQEDQLGFRNGIDRSVSEITSIGAFIHWAKKQFNY